VVQHKETTSWNNKISKLTGQIMEGWGIIGGAPSGGFTKVAIKARLPNSFAWKETKTKKRCNCTLNGGVHGNLVPRIKQGIDSFRTDSPHKTCLGLMNVLYTKKNPTSLKPSPRVERKVHIAPLSAQG